MKYKSMYEKQAAGRSDFGSSALEGGGIIGIDFGATQLRAAFVTEHGIGGVESRLTPNGGTADDVWRSLAALIESVIGQNGGRMPAAICAGVPSVVDMDTGTVYDVQHIPACKELPLGHLVTERFGVKALVNNDANAFALGEYYFGQAADHYSGAGPDHPGATALTQEDTGEDRRDAPIKSYPSAAETLSKGSDLQAGRLSFSSSSLSLVGLTIGTGLGAGLILDGRLYSGRNCGAGEIGCLPYLDANLERYVSGAFFNRGGMDGKGWYEKALRGDPDARALYREFGHHLGQAIKIAMYTYDPDRIVLGGSVRHAFDLYKEEMIRSMQDFDYPGILQRIQVYPSTLQQSAILGAASLYFDYMRR